jgi:CheY-like chemotaxis protein
MTDARLDVRLLSMVLEAKGVECDSVDSGVSALQRLKYVGVNKFDAVFLDYKMPVMVSVV